MTAPISSNINSVQLLRATNAFKDATAPKKQAQPEFLEEEISTPRETSKMFAKHNIDEIKAYAKSVGEDELSNEDIKYGMFYGRSVIVDYSV